MSASAAPYRRFIKPLFLTLAGWLVVQMMNAQLPAVSFHHLKRDADLFASSFDALAEDRHGFIWFGGLGGGGLYRYDGYSLQSFLPDPNNFSGSIAGSKILEVYCSPDDQVYVGTNFGFSIIDPVTGTIRSVNNRFDLVPNELIGWTYAFLKDTLRDVLWIGTGLGLAMMKGDDESTFTSLRPQTQGGDNFMHETISGILQDPQDQEKLWLVTAKGLFTYDIIDSSYTHVAFPAPWSKETEVIELYIDRSGFIWMAASDGSIMRYAIQGGDWKAFRIPIPDDLPVEQKMIVALLPAGEDEIWVGTMTTVGKLNLLTGDFDQWTYDADRPEGLLPRGVYRDLLNDRHGRLWISSWYGVQYAQQVFMPRSDAVSNLKVAITKVDATPEYEQKLNPLIHAADLSMYKDQRDVSFQYVLPNPLDASAVTYQYMLTGYDKDWITTDQREVRYTNLGGGNYSFLVRAREGDDRKWTQTTSLKLDIPNRLVEFWWFWVLLFGVVMLLAIILYRFLVNRAKKEERLKADFEHQMSEIQMQALRAQMNPHFLFNSLNSIKYFAISRSKEETAAYLSKFSLLVRSILNNSKSRTISLKDELDALQLYIEIEHLRLNGKFDYLIDIDSSIHIKQAQIPPMILQPYVENAIWHGLMHKEGRGKLLVQVKDMGHQIQCIIEDNGIGRAKAAEYRGKETDHKKSVGMQITSDRIELINRIYRIDTQLHVIDLTDEEGNATGTRVVINVPLIRDEEE